MYRERHIHVQIQKNRQKHDFIIQGTRDIQENFSAKEIFLNNASKRKTRKTNHAPRIDYEHFPTGRGYGKI